MNQPFRLPEGGLIDRDKPVTFRFDGKSYGGFAGDTLASALLANGVHHVARSFKYHRPRGILGAGPEDPAALVQLEPNTARTEPNLRATEIELYEGLNAGAQNCWPSLGFDIGAINDVFSRFFPAGFYYKTFMGGPGWMFFERFIRASAGLGVAPGEIDPDHYEHTNRHCDVLIIGAGPAGLAAARAAASTGARVILAEQTAHPGGQLLDEAAGQTTIDGMSARDWVKAVREEIEAAPEAMVLTRTNGFGYYNDNWFALCQQLQDHLPLAERDANKPRQRLWHVRARHIILATGAIERPLVFAGNDRPGVMLAGAVRHYLHRHAVLPGRRAAILANNNSAWQTAFDLKTAGAEMAAILDTRPDAPQVLRDRAEALGIPVKTGAAVTGTLGRRRIKAARTGDIEGDRIAIGSAEMIGCDLLAVSGGWSPNVALFSQSRGQLRYDDDIAGFRPARSWQEEATVGAANGTFDLAACLAEGAAAGANAARVAGFDDASQSVPRVSAPHAIDYDITPAWRLPMERKTDRAFVDMHNDVTSKDLDLAVREGYRSVEHAKRYTTLGMGTDQGKTSSVNGFGILSEILDTPIPEIGVTTYRPPFKPVTFGAVAGQHVGANFHPRRTTPMHEAHVEVGATFEIVGDWLRARVYPRAGEDFDAALQRECKAARTQLGMLDASTLGKIDIRGKNAREFLNRIYSNAWLKLPPGRCRYGLMLNEDGMVFDDGVTACLSDDHFHMTTTTGGAAGVLNWLEDYAQTEWPDLEVYLTSVTEQWAVASLCGPNSTALMAELLDDLDPDPESFPFMSWRPAHIAGIPVRVFRISFTGELSYEINIPARYGRWLWDRCMALGEKHGITPYGTEGMHLLRAEAGFVIVGQDTDGTVTPIDLGMDWAVKKTADFVGARSLTRPDTARTDRRQFVGLLSEDPTIVLPEGSQIIATPHETEPRTPMIGYVTSSYMSPNFSRSIALGLVEGGHTRMGEPVYVANKNGTPHRASISPVNFLKELGGAS
ncbi:sarcosine oxidase subunit alpha family protein [Cucumibacter marinus]|uniref:sarcosine oxidase subunit alpha family protein n=1 Tax=Cucumibacter marinus TaxID=1121252 RepID=UPI000426DFE4|nr:sarcosine oxidase subunit alpha family protein [Cucumibacter marinus]